MSRRIVCGFVADAEERTDRCRDTVYQAVRCGRSGSEAAGDKHRRYAGSRGREGCDLRRIGTQRRAHRVTTYPSGDLGEPRVHVTRRNRAVSTVAL
jgi:hypothetical protein